MSDWQTLRKQLLEEVDRPGDTSQVNRAMVEALRFHRADQFWFNVDRFELTTTANVYRYSLPSDFVKLIGDLYYTRANSPTSRRIMRNRTNDWVESFRYMGLDPDHWGDWEAGVNSGAPSTYAFFNDQLIVAPIPDTDSETISGRYLKDVGIPKVVYDGSAWQLYTPYSESVTLPATFTNAFLTDGQELIRARSKFILYSRYYRDDAAAQAALMEWTEALHRLRAETTRRQGTKTIRGMF